MAEATMASGSTKHVSNKRIKLPVPQNLLTQGQFIHQSPRIFNFNSWMLSNVDMKQEDILRLLPNTWLQLCGPILPKYTTQSGGSTRFGAKIERKVRSVTLRGYKASILQVLKSVDVIDKSVEIDLKQLFFSFVNKKNKVVKNVFLSIFENSENGENCFTKKNIQKKKL